MPFRPTGKGFDFHDRTGQSEALEATLALDAFPFPDTQVAKWKALRGLDEAASKIDLHGGHDGGKTPRYDQMSAINAAVGTFTKEQDRLRLVMATGTGKTYTAVRIV